MWIEIVDGEGKTMGAVNSEVCDLIKVGNDGPSGRALIRNAQNGEAYITRVSYLRLIETITQAEASALSHIASVVGEATEREQPRLVIP